MITIHYRDSRSQPNCMKRTTQRIFGCSHQHVIRSRDCTMFVYRGIHPKNWVYFIYDTRTSHVVLSLLVEKKCPALFHFISCYISTCNHDPSLPSLFFGGWNHQPDKNKIISTHTCYTQSYSCFFPYIFHVKLVGAAWLAAEIDLDLTRHDQRRVVSIMWSLAEKERMENLSDIVSAPKGLHGRKGTDGWTCETYAKPSEPTSSNTAT